MKGRAGALAVEMVFVLASVIWLKEWVFPFFISQWFPQADTASQMLEWILLVIGVITCFIYVGLGSSAWNHHGLKAGPSLGVFLVIHLPLLLPVALSAVPGTAFTDAWSGLIGDGLRLFNPARWTFHPVTLGVITCLLFLLGRRIRVTEREPRRFRGMNRGRKVWEKP
ncbi:hypothetical protein ACFQ49_00420 [Kroppenstedtia eburnea]|uniref:Uncharacterized protein n=1 Tax=Kroppenstedtia eburnea TaxID=714067 RepID=A0A1N7IQ63_9BACL|nr:hypothetical protein [Kroppenstedtia eburnea]QKI82072.1 hypothetical protein GXN75_08685 [Kroppenstedtia eburnea]SIS39212.1 hypothetical protein SAMN05421790_101221 [Kroppenstedtia eburnea]